METARIKAECPITTLAWSNDGCRILTAGDYLQLWQYQTHNVETGIQGITITVAPSSFDRETMKVDKEPQVGVWTCIWKVRPANPVHYLSHSPDGTLFATCGKSDRLVRIWYENQQLLLPGQIPTEPSKSGFSGKSLDRDISFGYIYVAHPRSVTALSWRKTSKFMPKGNVANVLVTSCSDNICRLWCETVLPDTAEGLPVSMHQLDPNASQDIKFRTHRQRAKFLQRFRHVRQSFATRKLTRDVASNNPVKPEPIGLLPSTYSIHEFHNYGYQGSGVSPGLHFHLAGTINAATDIPLVPSMAPPPTATVGNMGEIGQEEDRRGHHFVLHWMNNKEMEFTIQAERIMEDLLKSPMVRDDSFQGNLESELGPSIADRAGTSDVPSGSSPRLVTKGSKANVLKEHGGLKHTGSNSSLTKGQPGDQISVSSRQSDGRLTAQLTDTLDRRIEQITKEWHQNSDLLFSIHPIDGSLLVWVADFLDEYQPGAFRQAQVSFSSRIPNAMPLGDAMTIAANISVYNADNINFKDLFKAASAVHDSKEALKADENQEEDPDKSDNEDEEDVGEKEKTEVAKKETSPTKLSGKGMNKNLRYKPAPVVSLISKHTNGTLNLWSVMFADRSMFCSLLNISHCARASGHRFRVNDITCHPVLPLLLTTSHHNVVRMTDDVDLGINHEDFCSELILWRVDPVGPLSKSGGITELARVNSKEISAFTDVTWLPTLLPSTILGPVSNSPSACFVASDGHSLRVYQAVIDARTLLAEMNSATKLASTNKKNIMETSMMSMSSEGSSAALHIAHATKLHDKFRIVSTQSTARPGAVIELEPIEDATQDWQNTMLLHAFQEQLIVAHGNLPSQRSGGSKSKGNSSKVGAGLIPSSMSAMVDLQSLHMGISGRFCEPFYVLLVEKKGDKHGGGGFIFDMHMWKVKLCLEGKNAEEHDDTSSGTVTPDQNENAGGGDAAMSEIHVNTERVCSQRLPLPPDVEIVDCVAAAGHLSSASIFPACLAPYLIITACTDNTVRFWRTKMVHSSTDQNEFEWEEWRMESSDGTSAIQIPGRPLSVSAAYTGRIAIAYQSGHSYQKSPKRESKNDKSQMYINLCTAIYECESSGGSEWILEDTIYLKNIELQPQIPQMDMSVYDQSNRRKDDPMVKFAQHFEETSGNIRTFAPRISPRPLRKPAITRTHFYNKIYSTLNGILVCVLHIALYVL